MVDATLKAADELLNGAERQNEGHPGLDQKSPILQWNGDLVCVGELIVVNGLESAFN